MAAVRYTEGVFPPDRLDWEGLVPSIGSANAAVARYDAILSAIPNPKLFLSPLTTHEAVLSSRIEGTQATTSEVLEFDAHPDRLPMDAEKREDISEIRNYRRAMEQAGTLLKDLPLCRRVLLALHATLLEGVRGQGRSPGNFRTISNWIGPAGCSIEDATFVPVTADKLASGLDRWEGYLHQDAPDRLVQLAVVHAEFEALHPFLDGNGRIGRMLVPLFMAEKGVIQAPVFYISDYLNKNREEYYERLLAVSRDGDWNGWCRFFLRAVRLQAETNLNKANEILLLYRDMKARVAEITHSSHGIAAFDWIFARPVFRSSDFVQSSSVPKPTAARLIRQLLASGVIEELHPGRGPISALYRFPALMQIVDR